MVYADLLKEIWNRIYDPKANTKAVIEQFFLPNYEQCINGVHMNRDEYIHHVISQKQNITIDTIDYRTIIEKGNEIFAIYYPMGRNIDCNPIEAEVIAYFCFENKKMLKIHGQVRLIKGNLFDVDMKIS